MSEELDDVTDLSVYDLPFVQKYLNRLRCTRYVPVCPTFVGDHPAGRGTPPAGRGTPPTDHSTQPETRRGEGIDNPAMEKTDDTHL